MSVATEFEAVEPFPREVEDLFSRMILDPNHKCRERLDIHVWHRYHVFLNNPHMKPSTPHDSNLKIRALTSFELINNCLHRRPDARHPSPRYVVPASEVFEKIVQEHRRVGHAGREKTWAAVEERYYGISRDEVRDLCGMCKNCALNRPDTAKARIEPIIVNETFERVQIDLIDMRHSPSGRYNWILHVKDHWSKFTMLYPLHGKHSEEIARCLTLFIMTFFPMKIIQCDNGKEFKGALLILLRRHGIQLINGAPRTPQVQGLVEQANGVAENKIRAWKAENGSMLWEHALPEVTMQMNSQYHSSIGCTPYEVIFRQKRPLYGWLDPQERRSVPGVLCEGDNQYIRESDLQEDIDMQLLQEVTASTDIPVDPALQNNTGSITQDPVITEDPVLLRVRQNTTNARQRMVRKYEKRHKVTEYAQGDIVAIKLPRETRTNTDNKRLFGRILAMPYKDRYKLQTIYGRIDRLMPTRELIALPKVLQDSINCNGPSGEIALSRAALEASNSDRVIISCKCKKQCNTRRCRCFKESQKCSVHCHDSAEHDCGFLSDLSVRTEVAMIEKRVTRQGGSVIKKKRVTWKRGQSLCK
jgi:hypothetical protein